MSRSGGCPASREQKSAARSAKEHPRNLPCDGGQECLLLTSRNVNLPGCKSSRERKREVRSVQHSHILLVGSIIVFCIHHCQGMGLFFWCTGEMPCRQKKDPAFSAGLSRCQKSGCGHFFEFWHSFTGRMARPFSRSFTRVRNVFRTRPSPQKRRWLHLLIACNELR